MGVALICHLQRIEPLCPPPSGPGTAVDWSFSLNLSTSLDVVPTDNTRLPYLTPWNWKTLYHDDTNFPIKLAVGVLDVPSQTVTLLTAGAPLDGSIIPLPTSDQPDGVQALNTLKTLLDNNFLGAPFSTGVQDPYDPVWKPGEPEPNNAKLWAHLQGRLGSLAYPLSQWLNLSLCFKVTLPTPIVTQLQGLTPNQRLLFFAAPTLQISFPHSATETWTPDPNGPTIPPQYSVHSTTLWTMNGTPSGATVDTIQANLQAVAFGGPVADRLKPLATQWVNGTGNGWTGARWQSTLTHTLTSTFDLVSRLIDAARLDSAKPAPAFKPSDTRDLTLAALTLLRDLGDAGLHPHGNGLALLDEELNLVQVIDIPQLKPPRQTPPPQLPQLDKMDPANKDAYLRGLKRSFRAAVQWSDHLTILNPPGAANDKQDDVFNWYWQLVNAAPRAKPLIDSLLALPPDSKPGTLAPPPPDIVRATVLLDHLQAIFGSDDVVATLLINAWANAVPPAPKPIELPMNKALSFAPLTADADRPATGTSAFMLNTNNQLTAVPGTFYVTAAYHFAPRQQFSHVNHTSSVRLRYAKAGASPFEIVTAFRIGNFPATDFHLNRDKWTILSRLTKDSTEPENTPLTFELDPRTLIPGDTAAITFVAYYDPAAAGPITAV
jgi:hypothetical protein